MKKSIIVSLIIVGVFGAGILYYLFSPLFMSVQLDEEAPAALKVEEAADTFMVKAPLVGTLGHSATGTVLIVNTPQGKVLRYEDFKTTNGPDLFVYLSNDLNATEFADLGALKATEGSINYEIPDTVDLEKYRYVLIWCKQFGVLFNSADLKTVYTEEEMTEEVMELDAIVDTKETKMNMTEQSNSTVKETALFANGCFWCVEHDLEKVPGVTSVVSGYAGGTTKNPTYDNYHDGGHREVVEVTYNPQVVNYGNLVEHIIKHGDPTDAAGSFFDRGIYYAPAIYYKTDAEKELALAIIKAVDGLKVFDAPLPLAVLPTQTFWPAEEYHQDYSKKNALKYSYYRAGSGRTKFYEAAWGAEANTFTISNSLTTKNNMSENVTQFTKDSWVGFVLPSEEKLRNLLSLLAYKVTREDGTEPSHSHSYDKNIQDGIYVDVISGEPLFSSRDKYDSGTGWPSFVQPLSSEVVTLHVDKKLFSTRTEVRSAHADSHLGHVFDDGPTDRGGKRYCMNGVALRFIPEGEMEKEGYGYLLSQI